MEQYFVKSGNPDKYVCILKERDDVGWGLQRLIVIICIDVLARSKRLLWTCDMNFVDT